MIETKYIETSKLITHDRNPRKIDAEQFDILKKSITDNPEYFEVRPILCTPDFVVFAGNMRLAAARDLGLEKVPVAIMDIPEAKQRELMVRDNVQNGIWDADILSADFDLEELQGWGYDPVQFGYKSDFKPATPDTKLDESQKWQIECPDCKAVHIFSKSDLKPYDPDKATS